MPKNDDVSKGLNFNNLKNHNLRDICEKTKNLMQSIIYIFIEKDTESSENTQ